MTTAKHRVTVCREGWFYLLVLAVVFLGALIRDINLLMLLFGMLAGPLLYSWWHQWFCLRRIKVRRLVPDRVHAGDSFSVAIEVQNPRRWFGCWALGIDDQISTAAAGRQRHARAGKVLLFYLRPGQTQRLAYQVRLFERGEHEFGPLVVSTRFPLGLVRRRVTFAARDKIIVWPKLGRVRPSSQGEQPAAQRAQSQARRQRGFVEGDFYGLRDWRPGDNRRWIHWRTTARMGELMVRQFEQHRASDLAILLDLWLPAIPSLDERENVELAVSLAATLIVDHCRRPGGRLLLALPQGGDGEVPIVRGVASAALRERALTQLATCRPAPEDRIAQLLGRALGELHPGMRALLIATRHVDLTAAARLGAFANDPQRAAALSRLTVIETDNASLGQLFEAT